MDFPRITGNLRHEARKCFAGALLLFFLVGTLLGGDFETLGGDFHPARPVATLRFHDFLALTNPAL